MSPHTEAYAGESDERLMRRVQGDDTRAFEELYDRYAAPALRVARCVCHDQGRAEDAVQEGFLCLWRGRMGYRVTATSFKAWAMQIVRNRAIDSVRAEASRPSVAEQREDRAEPAHASVDEQVLARTEAQRMQASLRRLPEAQSQVITLAFFGGLTHQEIARTLSLPPGTVKGRMRLGLAKLRRDPQTPV